MPLGVASPVAQFDLAASVMRDRDGRLAEIGAERAAVELSLGSCRAGSGPKAPRCTPQRSGCFDVYVVTYARTPYV